MFQQLAYRSLILACAFTFCASPVRAEGVANNATAAPPAISRFEAMLVHVYQENPKINSERSALKIADEKLSQANAGFRPSLGANLGAGRQREKIEHTPWVYGDATDASLVATQPLFSGFGTVEQKRAANARIEAGRAHLLAIEQSVFFTAISDWLDVCEKEQVLALNADNLNRLGQYGDATRERFKSGDGTQTDIAQSESRLAQAQARYAVALADRDSARATYERDTGMVAQVDRFPPLPDNLAFEESECSYRIGIARDGIEAMHLLRERAGDSAAHMPSLILLDLNMPRMNGKQLLSLLKNDQRLKSIPVMLLTSSDAHHDIHDCYHLRAHGYLLKPSGVAERAVLAQQVTEFLSSGNTLSLS